jgi:hypothetical protein
LQEEAVVRAVASGQGAIIAGGFAEMVVTTIALRDLIRRSSSKVRGPKLLWLLGCSSSR